MWSSIENLKENLNRIALEIHDDEELSIYNSGDPPDSNSLPDRRISRNFSRTKSPTYHSPIANGFDSAHNPEIEKYKIEIKRLKESEAEIKALSVNYAALLKEKEGRRTIGPISWRGDPETGVANMAVIPVSLSLSATRIAGNLQTQCLSTIYTGNIECSGGSI